LNPHQAFQRSISAVVAAKVAEFVKIAQEIIRIHFLRAPVIFVVLPKWSAGKEPDSQISL